MEEMEPEVCNEIIEEVVANLIAYTCRRSHLSVDEMTTCHDIMATILSSEWQEELKQQIIATNPGL